MSKTWDHSIVLAPADRTCVRNRCGSPAVYLGRYRSRSPVTGMVGNTSHYLCERHGRSWAARHGLSLPEMQVAPAASPTGATIPNPIKEQ